MVRPVRRAGRRERLRPDDFDDMQYSVEVVRLGKSTHDAASDRGELVESAFVMLGGATVVMGAVGAGVVALETTTAMAREALWYLLPMLLLPLVWWGVLHAWETLVLTPKQDAPTPIETKRSTSKVAIF